MKLVFVSPFPPSQVTLNEYGYHLIKSFVNKPEVDHIYVLTNHIEDNSQYTPFENKGFSIIPCWKFNSPLNVLTIVKQLKAIKADVVIMNLQFMTFGDKKIAAALGLLTPLACKLLGIPSIVLLHNITETVNLETIGMAKSKLKNNLFLWIGKQLTKLVLNADIVGVTIKQYVDILSEKYKTNNVVLLPHGNFELPTRKHLPKELTEVNLMAFGKFGTYKKVEVLIEATKILEEKYPNLKFKTTIAGTDNPNVKGYLDNIQKKYADKSNLVFTGYVPEEKVAEIFQESTFVIFPYTTTTGSSGILHQAGSYARACILPKIDDLERVVEEEGYAGEYFEVENPESMVNAIATLIDNPMKRLELENQNYAAAQGLPMTALADMYLNHCKQLLKTNNKYPSYDKEADAVWS
jgi:glycosyltransferase involved in cell wall biosynthesis